MEDESTITLRNLQLMIANLSLDNARLQARVSILEAQCKEAKVEESAHE